MTTYIVRIYRHENKFPGSVVGQIEDVEAGTNHTFHSIAGLVNELVHSLGCDSSDEQVQLVVEDVATTGVSG